MEESRAQRGTNKPDRWGCSGLEPSLEELLSDHATAALMRADRVTLESIRREVSNARQCLEARRDCSILPSTADSPAQHRRKDCTPISTLARFDEAS
jgi:hypothetical protein